MRQEGPDRLEDGVGLLGMGPMECRREREEVDARDQTGERVAHLKGDYRVVPAPDQQRRLPNFVESVAQAGEVELFQHPGGGASVSGIAGLFVGGLRVGLGEPGRVVDRGDERSEREVAAQRPRLARRHRAENAAEADPVPGRGDQDEERDPVRPGER